MCGLSLSEFINVEAWNVEAWYLLAQNSRKYLHCVDTNSHGHEIKDTYMQRIDGRQTAYLDESYSG